MSWRRLGEALLVALACAGATFVALPERLALRPEGPGWSRVRGAAPRGVVTEQAGLLLAGVDRTRVLTVRVLAEPATSQPGGGFELRIDREVEARVAVERARDLVVAAPATGVPALRVELLVNGPPLRLRGLELELGPRSPWPAAAAAALALLVFVLAVRDGRPAPLALALGAGALVAPFALLPLGFGLWPLLWPRLLPALVLLGTALVLGLRRAPRAFAADLGLVLALVFGSSVRLLSVHSTGSFDTEYWKAWMHRTLEAGVGQVYGPAEALPAGHALAQYRGQEPAWKYEWHGRRFVVDYPPLAMLSWAGSYRLVERFAPGLSPLERDSVAVKLPALFGDLLSLFVLLWGASPHLRRGLVLGALYWALPISWLSSALLGYYDGILPPFVVLALVLAGRGQATGAGVVLALATLIKPTAAIVAPAVALALWRARVSLLRAALAGLAVAAVVFAPFVAAGTLTTALVHNARLFLQENLSGGYPNLWWLLGHALTWREHGLLGPVDFAPVALLAPVPARLLGTALFALCAAFLLRRQAPGVRGACLTGAWLTLAYGMLGVGVHENHPHALFLPLLLAGLVTARLRWLFLGAAVVYLGDMLALSGLGRFHGPRHLWLEPAAEAVGRWRMGLGFDLTLLLALLHLAVFAWALRGVRADGAAVAAAEQSPPSTAPSNLPWGRMTRPAATSGGSAGLRVEPSRRHP